MSAIGVPLPEILEAVEVARERGWVIERQYWLDRIDGRNCCCPLGALLVQCNLDQRPESDIDAEEVARRLGIDASWAEGFADGFDGNISMPSLKAVLSLYNEGHTAGREARGAIVVDS